MYISGNKTETDMARIGDVKSKIKFAFLPTKVGDRLLWFRKYIQHYTYSQYYLSVPIEGMSYVPPFFTEVVRVDYYRVKAWVKTRKELI